MQDPERCNVRLRRKALSGRPPENPGISQLHGCISIWLSYHAEQTMLRVQKNNETIRTLRIYNAQKTYELVGLDRIATVEKMLEDAGSQVKAPEKPADVLR